MASAGLPPPGVPRACGEGDPNHSLLCYDYVWVVWNVWEYRHLISVIAITIAALVLVVNFLEAGPGFLLNAGAVIGAVAYMAVAMAFLVATRRG
jgi:hypothetical protein